MRIILELDSYAEVRFRVLKRIVLARDGVGGE